MLITILTTGSRGDTQPYISLGLELMKKGHIVRIAASEGFKEFVEKYGLKFIPTRGNVSEIAKSDLAKDALNADNPFKFFKSMKNEKLMDLLLDVQHDLYRACQGADVIVYHPGAPIGYFVAKKMNIPSILAAPFPMTPTIEYPALLFYDWLRLGNIYNKITHLIFEQGFWMMCRGPLKKYWKNSFGVKPKKFTNPYRKQRTEFYPTIISCSTYVFKRPKDWSKNIHCYGYWFLETDKNYSPPENLKQFINEGEPPLYIGFGSIADKLNAQETTEMVIEALKLAGKRGIIATGWGGMEQPKENNKDVFFIDGAPHSWLFPKMAAVINHGGAGTTAEGLRAGVPSIIVPFANDQFAWGRRIYELGVGAKPIPRKNLTADKLAEAIRYTQSSKIQKNAKIIGEKIRAEKGVEKSAQIIINTVKNFGKRSRKEI